MNTARCALGLAFLISATAGVIAGQPTKAEVRDWWAAAMKYESAGKPKVSATLYEKVLAQAPRIWGDGSTTHSRALNNLANLYSAMGRYAKAEPLCRRSLEIREAKLGKDHSDTAFALNTLGTLYYNMGQYAKAEPLCRRSLEIREAQLGKDHPDTALALNTLAVLYRAMAQYAKAERLHRRSLEIREVKLGKDHPATALALNNLANIYYDMGQYANAERLHRRSLEIREVKFGKDHPYIAQSLNNLANLYHAVGQYAKAEPLYRRSLEIYETKLGKDHRITANTLDSLARLYGDMGQYAKAEPLQLQSLHVRRARLGKNHPDVRQSLTNLAYLHAQTKRPRDALRSLDQARRIARHHLVSVLPILSDGEQLAFLDSDQIDLHKALSLVQSHAGRDEDRERAAGWLINARAAAQEAVAERVLLARDNPDPAFAEQLRELVAIRQEMAKLTLMATTPAKAEQRRQRMQELTEEEKLLSTRLHVADYRLTRDDPWVDLDDVRCRMPQDAILIDIVRMPVYDFQAKDKPKAWQPARYLAVLTPKAGEVQFVDLGPAEAIDSAIRDARKAISDSPAVIRSEGEIDAEKIVKVPLAKLAKLVLQPLRPHLDKHPLWILCPDGNLWLAPWAALPLDEKTYVIEKHRLRYVASGRDLVLNALKLDHISTAPAIFADPAYDLSPGAMAAQGDELRGGTLAHPLRGRRLAGRIEDWNVSFEFKHGGTLVIRDEDAQGQVAGEGSWTLKGQELTMQTQVSRFTGTIEGERINGKRTVRKDDGMTSTDNWSLKLPADDPIAGLLDVRAPRRLDKVARLPGTAAEAEAITPSLTKYAGAPQRYLDARATVGAFQKLKGPKVLVLSTHGFFLPDQEVKPAARDMLGESGKPKIIPGLENPLLRSGLLLAGCNRRDQGDTGVLTGLEIVGTDLRGTELVVLSACETGLGDIRNGEGVAGLRQAFQIAGAEAVVATLWQVSDRETAQLMSSFFANLAKNEAKDAALRSAQLERIGARRREYGAAHPFFWGAFTVTGR